MSIAELNRAIETGDLDVALRIYQPLSQDLNIPEDARARSALRLSVAFRNKGNFEQADALYRSMEGLGNSEEVASTRARAAFNLFESYRKSDELGRAAEILSTMAKLLQSDDIKLLRAMAAVNLVESLSAKGDAGGARAAYEEMATIGKSEELNTIRATAANFLLEAYEALGDYGSAKDIFDSLGSMGVGDSEDVSIACAGACVIMARICVKVGKVDEAKSYFHLVSDLEQKFPYLWERKDEVFSVLYEATGEVEF
ncbi:MAG: hypothetical protein LBF40_01175 [Deltaproteobacteria bacterium]|jgi:tetratricopeptide (TPR) repeat protein|nr:hypothetical protein [Deltaproteobacteria bacterium]